MGGIGMQRLYTNQGVKNTISLLKHLRAKTTVGQLLLINVKWLQRWSGIGKCVMESPEAKIPPMTAKFMMSIRDFLSRCRASLLMKEKPKTQRVHDSFLMDRFLEDNIQKKKLNVINKVRLFLQVELVSDITNPEGTKIDQAWLGEGEKPSWSTQKWPKVKTPSEKMWKM